MNYAAFFADQLDQLRAEGNYRVFAELERDAGDAPNARLHSAAGARPVTVWCSNDYLGMGKADFVRRAVADAALQDGAGAGGTGRSPQSRRAGRKGDVTRSGTAGR